MIKNWRTSLVGIITIIIAIYHCFEGHHLDLQCVLLAIPGLGFLLTKDQAVTGGTVAATVEAERRVDSPKI
jgi:hypothetical protein